jgi:hypothetical protein
MFGDHVSNPHPIGKTKPGQGGPRRLDGEILDVSGVAKLIGCSNGMVRTRAARGLLPPSPLGCQVDFHQGRNSGVPVIASWRLDRGGAGGSAKTHDLISFTRRADLFPPSCAPFVGHPDERTLPHDSCAGRTFATRDWPQTSDRSSRISSRTSPGAVQ